MHIIYTSNEKPAIKKLELPEGTTLVQCRNNEHQTPMYQFVVEGGELKMQHNHVENDRAWKKGEEEDFRKGITRESIIDFFLGNEDRRPYREYQVMSNVEHEHFKFVTHGGTYQPDEESGERRNIFKISLNTDSDIDAAAKEAVEVFTKVAKAYPKWNPLYIDIFEHTLSEGGIYYALWNRRKGFKMMKCTYGREEELAKFTSWRSLLEYVSQNHYYEDPIDKYKSLRDEDYYPYGDEY
ncbi:MAG: hypothetical protein K5880_14525 [Hydrogenophaga sp.]|uniref:hypothetical protein n=1 Tax=Hydrogenophaga sp. TaxID=1904254 RepID=UPI002616B21A|nr:hypothetical protein [Hydrogenophaga sp.]MCV0439838.1 hypothetical protein [Hydrogenophaga sp.]